MAQREEFDCALHYGDVSYDYCRVQFDNPTADGWITLFESRCICPGQGQNGSFTLKVSSLKVAKQNHQWCLKGETYNGGALTLTPKNQSGSEQSLKNLVLGCQRKLSEAITVGRLSSTVSDLGERVKEIAQALLNLVQANVSVSLDGEDKLQETVQQIIDEFPDTDFQSSSKYSQRTTGPGITAPRPADSARASASKEDSDSFHTPVGKFHGSLLGNTSRKRMADLSMSHPQFTKRSSTASSSSLAFGTPKGSGVRCTAAISQTNPKSCMGILQIIQEQSWLCQRCHITGKLCKKDKGMLVPYARDRNHNICVVSGRTLLPKEDTCEAPASASADNETS